MVTEGDSESMALVPVEDADGSVHGSASGEPSIPSREALELADSILEERFDTSDCWASRILIQTDLMLSVTCMIATLLHCV